MPKAAHPIDKQKRGPGRPPGALNESTRRMLEFAQEKGGLTPLEALLGLMRMAIEEGDQQLALECAAKAAPYVHPKLQAVVSHEASGQISHTEWLRQLQEAEAAGLLDVTPEAKNSSESDYNRDKIMDKGLSD